MGACLTDSGRGQRHCAGAAHKGPARAVGGALGSGPYPTAIWDLGDSKHNWFSEPDNAASSLHVRCWRITTL